MADYITVTVPEVTAASISPQPATINTAFTISVTVQDVTKTLYPEARYSGEYYAGEA